MRVSQLIRILQADLAQNDDTEVLYLSGLSLYEFTFLGRSEAECGSYFWFTTDGSLTDELDINSELYRAPAYKVELKIIK